MVLWRPPCGKQGRSVSRAAEGVRASDPQQPGMTRLGVGLIGCGVMGRSLARQLVELDSAFLAGVADVQPVAAAQAAAELGGVAAYESAEALLDRPEVQAVLIASPGFQHRPLTELAASRGKHVFVEKPMATNVPDCDGMIAAAERAGVLLMVGQVLRFHPYPSTIIETVRRGDLGAIWGMNVTRIGGGYGGVWKQDWRNSRANSGGVLMEVNAHEVDFMRQVCGRVVRVYAEARHFDATPIDYPDLNYVSLRFESGAIGLLHSSQVCALGDSSGMVQGSEGTMLYAGHLGEGGELHWKRRSGELTVFRAREMEIEVPVRREVRLFVEAVQQGLPSPIPGAEGRENVRVAEAAYQSAETGEPVLLS
ncbi:MAG: Gfo/Idh/MocA family oxidoreductase [Armatimonadetes bacterium]|nr:Gfo/Idh/MocA family oxidoreductase [Armatimonadota bacterium]